MCGDALVTTPGQSGMRRFWGCLSILERFKAYILDLFKNPVGSLPTKGWLQVSQKTMIF
jgi:hypothetical protein